MANLQKTSPLSGKEKRQCQQLLSLFLCLSTSVFFRKDTKSFVTKTAGLERNDGKRLTVLMPVLFIRFVFKFEITKRNKKLHE